MSENFNQPQTENFIEPLVELPKSSPLSQVAETISKDKQVKTEVQEAKEVEEQQDYHGIKTTLFRDPSTGQRYKIPSVFSPNPLASNILSYLENTGFVHILSIGQSGSGKTTWTKYLVHQLHEHKNFQVHWYVRDQIQQLDKIISSLQKGISHIIILDDASFTLEELPKDKVNEIAKKLTYIRHEVKSDVIVIMNIHYSKAIKKFFRSVPFTYLTSINMEEVNTFQDVFGAYSRYRLKDFSRYYQQMMLKKKWTIEIDRWNNKVQTYHTNKPFRVALANEINHLHFFYYTKHSCDICDPDYQTKRVVDDAQLVQSIVDKYGKDRARSMIYMYAFTKHGIRTMDTKRQSIWNLISDFDRNNQVDWSSVCKYLKQHMSKKRPHVYIKKQQYATDLNDIINEATRPKTVDEMAVEKASMDDFESDTSRQMDELDRNDPLVRAGVSAGAGKNTGFGDDTAIEFGGGLRDTDGQNPKSKEGSTEGTTEESDELVEE